MRILICGASGFVGRHFAHSLSAIGHTIIRAVRTPQSAQDLAVDFSRDTSIALWQSRLSNIDVVINAVGLLRDTPSGVMEKVHGQTPSALFHACAQAGVRAVINISALGMGGGVHVPYFDTRVIAENAVMALPASVRWLNIRPSIIDGAFGKGSAQFRLLAKFPILMLPIAQDFIAQPVHIHDIVRASIRWLSDDHQPSQTLIAVGAETTTMAGLIRSYRAQMGKGRSWILPVPAPIIRLAAKIGDLIPNAPFCSQTQAMLQQANVGDSTDFTRLLGKTPMSYRQFIAVRGFYS